MRRTVPAVGLLARPAAALPMSQKRKAAEEVPDEGPPTPPSDKEECIPIVEAEVDPDDPEVLAIKTVRPRKRPKGPRRVVMTVEDQDSGNDETEPQEPKALPKEHAASATSWLTAAAAETAGDASKDSKTPLDTCK